MRRRKRVLRHGKPRKVGISYVLEQMIVGLLAAQVSSFGKALYERQQQQTYHTKRIQ